MQNKTLYPALLTGFFAILIFAFSCTKDPETIIKIETKTITITDTITVTITDTLTLTDTLTIIETITESILDTATTFILVKHAEKGDIGTDPDLTDAGMEQAMELSRVLENVPLDAVFASNYNRTQQTAAPTADAQGLMVTTYDAFQLEPFIDVNLPLYHEGIILVVGHSNTTPDMLNLLVGEDIFPEIPEMEYDHIYIVSVFEKGRANVVQMKYGE